MERHGQHSGSRALDAMASGLPGTLPPEWVGIRRTRGWTTRRDGVPRPGAGPPDGMASRVPGAGPPDGMASGVPGAGPPDGMASRVPGAGPRDGMASGAPEAGPPDGMASRSSSATNHTLVVKYIRRLSWARSHPHAGR